MTPEMSKCQLCGEPIEEPDQPKGAELCNSCAAYLDAKFGPLGDVLAGVTVCDACDGTCIGKDTHPTCRKCGGAGAFPNMPTYEG
jgi:hypothetical protein